MRERRLKSTEARGKGELSSPKQNFVSCLHDPQISRGACSRQLKEPGVWIPETEKVEHLSARQEALAYESQEGNCGTRTPKQKSGKSKESVKLGVGIGCCHFNVSISKYIYKNII